MKGPLLYVAVARGRVGVCESVDVGASWTYGRGGGDERAMPVSDHPALSRSAGLITNLGGRTQVRSLQRKASGHTRVVLPGGHVAADLSHGDEYVLADPLFEIHIQLVGSDGESVVLQISRDELTSGGRGIDESSGVADTRVAVAWPAKELLKPRGTNSAAQWRTVVAIACAMSLASGRPPSFAALRMRCTMFFHPDAYPSPVTARWLSDRQDAALRALGLDVDGSDKLPRLVAYVLGARLIEERTLRAVAVRIGLESHR